MSESFSWEAGLGTMQGWLQVLAEEQDQRFDEMWGHLPDDVKRQLKERMEQVQERMTDRLCYGEHSPYYLAKWGKGATKERAQRHLDSPEHGKWTEMLEELYESRTDLEDRGPYGSGGAV